MPESDLDLDTLYTKLLQPTSQLQQLLDQPHCSISPEISSCMLGCKDSFDGSATTPAGLYADLFKWYDKNKSGAIEQDELQVRCGSGDVCTDHAACIRLTGCRTIYPLPL